jgi:hypothetical protein
MTCETFVHLNGGRFFHHVSSAPGHATSVLMVIAAGQNDDAEIIMDEAAEVRFSVISSGPSKLIATARS